MKTYLICAILLLCTLNAVGQSCPSTTMALGHELPVVQLGSQCFVLVNNGDFLNSALATQIGVVTTTMAGPFKVTTQTTGGNITNYQYAFSMDECKPHELISLEAQVSFKVTVEGLSLGSTNVTVTGGIELERDYDINVFQSNGETITQLDMSNQHFINEEYDVSGGGILGALVEAAVSAIGTTTLRSLVLDAAGDGNTIVKLGDQVITIPAEITGPSIICNSPIILSASPDFDSYLWSDNSTASTIEVQTPGNYSVIITDGCNKTILSASVTQGAEAEDFINSEVLCTGKVKLNALGFSSVIWNTGVEANFIEVGTTGTYSAEVTTQDGCTGRDQVKLTFGAPCQPPVSPTAGLNVTAVCSDFPNLLRRWKITNPNSAAIRMDWEIVGTIQKTWLDVPPGDSYLSTVTAPLNQNLLKVYWHDEKGQIKSLQQVSTTSRCQKGASSSSIATSGRIETELKVFPNPAKDQFMLEIPSDDERTVPLQILSASGIVWYNGTIQLSKGQNFISNDISRFDNGAYVIKLGSETIRFMKE